MGSRLSGRAPEALGMEDRATDRPLREVEP